jgi:hypothetical protein
MMQGWHICDQWPREEQANGMPGIARRGNACDPQPERSTLVLPADRLLENPDSTGGQTM